MKKNDVVIGMALNYGIPQVRNFVESFKRHCDDDFHTNCALVIDPGNEKLEEYLYENDVSYNYFESRRLMPGHVINQRHFRYVDILLENPHIDRVLITDVRDVVFQGNPFLNVLEDKFVWLFEEDRNFTIASQSCNADWMTHIFGPQALWELGDNRILCGGTIMADRQSYIDLILGRYAQHVTLQKIEEMRLKGVALAQQGRHDVANAIQVLDQCVFNYIACKHPEGITRKENGDIIGTLGLTCPGELEQKHVEVTPLGTVHVYGKIPAVLHQYDRSARLQQLFDTMYSK